MKKIPTQAYQKQLLRKNLDSIFGEFDDTFLAELEQHLEWFEIDGGEVLFNEGEEGDALYFIISGRLQAFINYKAEDEKKLGDIIRGETVGEMAVFTGERRIATVIAIRDSVLVKLNHQLFKLVINKYPAVNINVTKLIIERLQKTQLKKEYKKPVNLCVVPLHTNISLQWFCDKFYTELKKRGNTCFATQAIAREESQFKKISIGEAEALTYWIDEKEAENEFLVFVADYEINEWTSRCLQQADVVMLLANATVPNTLTPIDVLKQQNKIKINAEQHLILIHPTETILPKNTAQWLELRPWVSNHYHIKEQNIDDVKRLARLYSGTAIGLVLAGGGCKGFAHVGVLQALREAGIPIDVVGGTSVGAQVGACVAFNPTIDNLRKHLREGAMYNPTKDINLYPIVSIIQGKRIRNMIRTTIFRFSQKSDIDLSDTWLTFYAICTNYTHAKEELHTRGSMATCLQATTAIPGVFPPVINNKNLLIDGGTFNNFPADAMANFGVSKIIGIDFSQGKIHELKYPAMPTAWELFTDKFRKKRNKKYRLPGLFSILLNAPLLHSYAKHAETKNMVDLYFNPNVDKYGLVNWKAFDAIVAEGYKHAKEVLSKLSEQELHGFKN